MKRQLCVALEAERVWLLGEKLVLLAALGQPWAREELAQPTVSKLGWVGGAVLTLVGWSVGRRWAASVSTGKGEETRAPNPKLCGQGQMPFPRYQYSWIPHSGSFLGSMWETCQCQQVLDPLLMAEPPLASLGIRPGR